LIPKLQERMKKPENAEKVSRSVGIFVSLIILIVLITVLLNMLIPELYSSIRNMVLTLPKQVNDALDKINSIQLEDSTTVAILKNALEEGTTMLTNWLRTDLMTQVNSLMSNLTVGIFNVISEVFNMLIGVIVSVYILYSKEIFARQCKKAVYALFRADRANMVLHITTKSNEIFGGFVIGKILDSAIIGLLCFIGLTILNMPYTMLVSVIVGVTNVIPFFGPYIGAIPSTILIALEDPMKGVYFLIFILVLQQFDGNILGPKMMEAVTVNFTYPFLKKVEQLADDKTMILLCPKTTLALIGTEKAKFVDHQLEEPIGYAQACIHMIGKAHFAGQMCIKNVGYHLNHGIFKEVKLL